MGQKFVQPVGEDRTDEACDNIPNSPQRRVGPYCRPKSSPDDRAEGPLGETSERGGPKRGQYSGLADLVNLPEQILPDERLSDSESEPDSCPVDDAVHQVVDLEPPPHPCYRRQCNRSQVKRHELGGFFDQ
jgi:hypothetical protein